MLQHTLLSFLTWIKWVKNRYWSELEYRHYLIKHSCICPPRKLRPLPPCPPYLLYSEILVFFSCSICTLISYSNQTNINLLFLDDVYDDMCLKEKMQLSTFVGNVTAAYPGITQYSQLNSTMITSKLFAACAKSYVSPADDYLQWVNISDLARCTSRLVLAYLYFLDIS